MKPADSPQGTLGLARRHHKAGDLLAADKLYRQALEADPGNSDILNGLGQLAVDRGDVRGGIEMLRAALAKQPLNAVFLNTLGNAYRLAERPVEALEALRRAVQLAPDFAEPYANVGAVYHGLGQLGQAEEWYRRAIVLKPRLAVAHSNLGEVLRVTDRLAEARVSCLNAIEFDPNFAQAHSHLGNTLRLLGRLPEAEASCRRALALEPNMAEGHNNLGVVLHHSGRHREAEAHFRRAIELKPASAVFQKNLGGALHALERLDEAEAACRQALAMDPRLGSAYENLALIHQADGQFAAADASIKRAAELNPNAPLTRWNYAVQRLLQGDYAQGLELYESRFAATTVLPMGSREQFILRTLSTFPRWSGESLAGKTLLVWSEQGLGDAIMMFRYLPMLKALGAARILLYVVPEMARLARELREVDRLVTGEELGKLSDFDLHCPIMSLPYLLGTRLETIPAQVPYLRIPRGLKQNWLERLAEGRKLNVGLAWAGNKSNMRDRLRSVPLSTFQPLGSIGGIRIVSLQKGAAQAEIQGARLDITDWMAQCNDLADTASLIDALDLVITVDTVIAHIAGALGQPVWMLNRLESEWRWMIEREDSPWYPTMRIYRQEKRGDWTHVVARIASDLPDFVRRSSRPGT